MKIEKLNFKFIKEMRNPICHPYGWDMAYLLEAFWRKLNMSSSDSFGTNSSEWPQHLDVEDKATMEQKIVDRG